MVFFSEGEFFFCFYRLRSLNAPGDDSVLAVGCARFGLVAVLKTLTHFCSPDFYPGGRVEVEFHLV